jgi:polygalacturonase
MRRAATSQNIRARRIHYDGTDNGIRIKANRDRGSDVSHIEFRDIEMKNVKNAVLISEYYPKVLPAEGESAQPVTRLTPHFHDIVLENVTAVNSVSDGAIVGLPEAPVLGVVLRNVKLNGHKGMTIAYAEVQGSGVTIAAEQGNGISRGPGAKVSLR